MRNALLACTLLLSLPAMAQQPFDFKGLPLGASKAELLEKFPEYYCRTPKNTILSDTDCSLVPETKCITETPPQDRACRENVAKAMTYAGTRAEITLMLYADKLGMANITTAAESFPGVVAALRERFGEPNTKSYETVTNRAGTKFENQILEWKRAGTTIRAEKYGTRVDRSSVYISSEAYMDEYNRRKAAQTKQGAKDI